MAESVVVVDHVGDDLFGMIAEDVVSTAALHQEHLRAIVTMLFTFPPRIEDVLRKFPDAKLIYMIRDPAETLPSGLSLVTGVQEQAFNISRLPEPKRARFIARLSKGLSLLLTRFVGRQRELAIRAALGAARGRQWRQLITETVVLFAAGAATGLWLMALTRDYLTVLVPRTLFNQLALDRLAIDGRVLAFSGAITMITAVAFGTLAAFRAGTTDAQTALRATTRSTARRETRRTLDALVGAEVALAFALLVAAVMMVDSLQRLQTRDLGFALDRLVTAQASLTGNRYESGAARVDYIARVVEEAGRLPGVRAVGVTTVNPICCGDWVDTTRRRNWSFGGAGSKFWPAY